VFSKTVELDWQAPSDGGDVAEYRVSVDGEVRRTVEGHVLHRWVADLEPDTTMEISLEAIDSDGSASLPAVIEVHTNPLDYSLLDTFQLNHSVLTDKRALGAVDVPGVVVRTTRRARWLYPWSSSWINR
jgi:hypothetical protein